MLLRDVHSVHINTILEPPPFFGNLEVVTTHLPLSHPAILSKRPVLEAITSLPLHLIVRVLVLVPELNSDLVILESEQLFAELVVLLFLPLPVALEVRASILSANLRSKTTSCEYGLCARLLTRSRMILSHQCR